MTTENKTIRQFNFVVVCEVTEIDGVEHREYWLDGERTHVYMSDSQVYEYQDVRAVKDSEITLCSDIQEVISSLMEDQSDWEKEK